MDRAAAAEKILRLAVLPERASELVGDLLESRPGMVRFWAAIVGLLVAFSWRTILGIVSAPYLGMGLWAGSVALGVKLHFVQLHPIKQADPVLLQCAVGACILLWILSTYLLVRSGISRLCLCSFLLAIFASGSTSLYKAAHGPLCMGLAGSLLVIFAITQENRRRAYTALLSTLLCTWFVGLLVMGAVSHLSANRGGLLLGVYLALVSVTQAWILHFVSKVSAEPRSI